MAAVETNTGRSSWAPSCGQAGDDPRRSLAPRPTRRSRGDLPTGARRPGRPAPAVSLRLLRLEARPLRPAVRRRQPPAPRGGSGDPGHRGTRANRSSSSSRRWCSSRPKTSCATSCCSNGRSPATSPPQPRTPSPSSSTRSPGRRARFGAGAADPGRHRHLPARWSPAWPTSRSRTTPVATGGSGSRTALARGGNVFSPTSSGGGAAQTTR